MKVRNFLALASLGMIPALVDADAPRLHAPRLRPHAPELRSFLRTERFFAGEGNRRCAAVCARYGQRSRCRNLATRDRGPLAYCVNCARRREFKTDRGWRWALSSALRRIECSAAERQELRDWLAQETPRPIGSESADQVVARMLRTQRQG